LQALLDGGVVLLSGREIAGGESLTELSEGVDEGLEEVCVLVVEGSG
jgi:hypothetical protein